jgi:hypothetical protein
MMSKVFPALLTGLALTGAIAVSAPLIPALHAPQPIPGVVAMAQKQTDSAKVGVGTTYLVEAFDRHGNPKWTERVHNLVPTAGLNSLLDCYLKGSGCVATWYVGLKGAGTIAAGDTMASHAGWSEIHSTYSESVRQTLTLGSVSGGSVNNSASKATYTFTGSATVAGIFLTSVSTKNGTTGTLFSVADFSSARTVASGDLLRVTATVTATSS